jgi:hypothetical protein
MILPGTASPVPDLSRPFRRRTMTTVDAPTTHAAAPAAPPRTGALSAVLWFKITVTALLWCIPLLLVPLVPPERLGFPPLGSRVFLQLLGAAFLALLVGYVGGLRALRRGESAADVVTVGLVSNGLACLLVVGYGVAGEYASWGLLAQVYMWLSAAATGLVTLGLAVFGRR